jgi:hypothetical protein
MKHFVLLFFAAMLLKVAAIAQTPFYTEEFNSPTGWELDANWSIESGTLLFSWTPTITNFDLSAVSSEIQFPETVSELKVSQYLDVFSSGAEYAEIIIVSGDEETAVWEYDLDNGNWGTTGGSELVCDITAFGGQNVKVKFRTYGGTTYNWNYWNIYEFSLTSMLDNDLAVVDFYGTTVIEPELPGSWDLEIKNVGVEPQSDFMLKLVNIKTGEVVDEIAYTETIESQQTEYFTFQWQTDQVQNTALQAVIEIEGDEFPMNNTSKGHFVRVDPDIDYSILFWDFDNDIQTVSDPEVGDMVTPATALSRVVESAGFDYDYVTSLPNNLGEYDIVIATLGCYCLS